MGSQIANGDMELRGQILADKFAEFLEIDVPAAYNADDIAARHPA